MSFYFIIRRAWLCTILAPFCICSLSFSAYGTAGEEYCVSADPYCVLCAKKDQISRIRIGYTDSYGAIVCNKCSELVAPHTEEADSILAPGKNLDALAASLSSISDASAVDSAVVRDGDDAAVAVRDEAHTDPPHAETMLSRPFLQRCQELLTQVMPSYTGHSIKLLRNIMDSRDFVFNSEDRKEVTRFLYMSTMTLLERHSRLNNGQLSMFCNLLIPPHPKIVPLLKLPVHPDSPFPVNCVAIHGINNLLVQSLLTRYYLCSGVWWMVDINLFICYHTRSLPALDHEYTSFGRGCSLMSPVPSRNLFDFYRKQILYENALGFPAFQDRGDAESFLAHCPDNWEIVSIKKGEVEDAEIYVVGIFPDQIPREAMFNAITSPPSTPPFLRPAPEMSDRPCPKIIQYCGVFYEETVPLSPLRLFADKAVWGDIFSPALSDAAAHHPSPPVPCEHSYYMCFLCKKTWPSSLFPMSHLPVCGECLSVMKDYHGKLKPLLDKDNHLSHEFWDELDGIAPPGLLDHPCQRTEVFSGDRRRDVVTPAFKPPSTPVRDAPDRKRVPPLTDKRLHSASLRYQTVLVSQFINGHCKILNHLCLAVSAEIDKAFSAEDFALETLTEDLLDSCFLTAKNSYTAHAAYTLSTDQSLMLRIALKGIVNGATTRASTSGEFGHDGSEEIENHLETLVLYGFINRIRHALSILEHYEPIYNTVLKHGFLEEDASLQHRKRIFEECILGYPAFRVDADPDTFLTRLQARLRGKLGIDISEGCVFKEIRDKDGLVGYLVGTDIPASIPAVI
jgi:hypothetical protein